MGIACLRGIGARICRESRHGYVRFSRLAPSSSAVDGGQCGACPWRIPNSFAFFVRLAILLGSGVRDLAVLFLHLLATVARLAGPGGARSVVAESVLVKHQLLILNRSRKRSPNLRSADRVVAGLCAVFMRPSRLIRSAIVFKPATLLSLHRALIRAEISAAVLVEVAGETWSQRAQPGRHRRGRRHETAEPDVGVSTDRAADHAGLRSARR